MKTTGVYVGRFSPLHVGHEVVIRKMQEACGQDCLLVIGSSNNPFSLRHFFSYEERKSFIKKVFPDIRVVGLPDYNSDAAWLSALDDILLACGIDPKQATYFGGCEEDILFFVEDGRKCRIINRFDELKASATEVRDHLIHGRNKRLAKLLNALIYEDVISVFAEKWEQFKKI